MSRRTPTSQEVFLRGVWRENPVLVQLLGLCPALAVTNTVANSLAMGLATFFVLLGSSTLIATSKRFIPREVRISAYILVIATFVTIADLVLNAVVPEIHRALGAFIALIVVNCMILGRQEAFASKQPVGRAILDAAGTGLGFIIALTLMGAFRGVPVFGPGFEPWIVMILPAGGFFALGFILLGFGWWEARKAEAVRPRRWPHSVATEVAGVEGGAD